MTIKPLQERLMTTAAGAAVLHLVACGSFARPTGVERDAAIDILDVADEPRRP